MLFRPPAEHRLDAARNLLDDWNAEADRFRRAAELARRGEPPAASLVEAALEAHDGLMELLGDIDVALERTPPGHPDIGRLLQAQVTAVALRESIGRSCDLLERVTPVQDAGTVGRVPHEFAGDQLSEIVPQTLMLEPGDTMPNSRLPVLIYRAALPSGDFVALFEANGWGGTWRDGVYDYDHYHSNAHEVLGVAIGRARLRLGGDGGQEVEVNAGDALVLPAGTGHRRISLSEGLLVIGAYPPGQERYDICRARDPAADLRIDRTKLPGTDPVLGASGPLLTLWR